MIQQLSRRLMYLVAESRSIKKLATKHGMKDSSGFARRFIAGETSEDAITVIKDLNGMGMSASLDLLGEDVKTAEETHKARDTILDLLALIKSNNVDSHISVKLTQLGLNIPDKGLKVCKDNMQAIVEAAEKNNVFVRIDMEGSGCTEKTLGVFRYLHKKYGESVGIVLQSYLYRTESDVREMNKIGAKVRLCKGAYLEPEIIAFQKKKMVDLNYDHCLELLMKDGNFPAVATHDTRLMDKAKEYAKKHDVSPEKFEFQMIYGIRRDVQRQIIKDGYRLRIYVPFGKEWFPYYTRRLGERIDNLTFILKSIYLETPDDKDTV